MISVRMFVKRTPASPSVYPSAPLSSSNDYSDSPHLGQVGKVLGDRWKALSEKQRLPYEQKAQADKKRYEDEKAKYMVSTRLLIGLHELLLTLSQAGDAEDESE